MKTSGWRSGHVTRLILGIPTGTRLLVGQVAALLCVGVTFLLLLAWGFPAYAQGSDITTATAAAQQVAAVLGIPTGDKATFTQETWVFGFPVWHLEYKDLSSFSFDSEGTLLSFINYAAVDAAPSFVGPPPLSESEAVAKATNALKALGMPQNLVLRRAELVVPPEGVPSTYEWQISWQRTYQGLPYEESADALTMLNPETGAILSASISPMPPAPASVAVNVSEAEAAAIAVAHLQSLAPIVTVTRPQTSATLEIAHPYLYLSGPEAMKRRLQTPEERMAAAASGEKPMGPMYSDLTVLVWTVLVGEESDTTQLEQGYPPLNVIGYVQVDAATGAVVGDAQAGGTFLVPRPKSSKAAAVQTPRPARALKLRPADLRVPALVTATLLLQTLLALHP